MINRILEYNGRHAQENLGLIAPYYDLSFAVKRKFEMLEGEFENTSKLSSFLLKSLIEIAAR